MRTNMIVLLIGSYFVLSSVANASTFSDDFESYGIDPPLSSEWTDQIGSWTIGSDGNTQYLSGTSNYGVVWKKESFGVYQHLKVDAYFNPGGYQNDQIAHLRLRTGENLSGTNPFWDTGYLAQFTPSGLALYDASPNSGTTEVANLEFLPGTSPISTTGWYTLGFNVSGTGTDTALQMSVNGTNYIDTTYNTAPAVLDSGYIGLGRLIRYDNASGYSSTSAVPIPGAIALFLPGIGLISLIGIRNRKRVKLKRT